MTRILLTILKIITRPLALIFNALHDARLLESRYHIARYIKQEYRTDFTENDIVNMLEKGSDVNEIIKRVSN